MLLKRNGASDPRRPAGPDAGQRRSWGCFFVSPPVLIDEIQYAPGLLPHIKIAVDTRQQPGDFWLTGSQQFHLMQGVSESLAGRVGIVNLLGFSRRELIGQSERIEPFLPGCREEASEGRSLGLMDLYQLIWRGSLPKLPWTASWIAICSTDPMCRPTCSATCALASVGDELAFMRFLRAAAARTGQLLNLAAMARDVDVAPNTAKNWLSILKASGMIYLLEPFHSNVTKRLVKSPKLYFLDTGLAAYLTEWSSPETLEAGA